MSFRQYKIGTIATCGFCGIEHKVEAIRRYDGGVGVILACGHRNGYCEKCDLLVRDATDLISTITPECPFCAPIAVTT